jgi:hypothetical protein
VATLLLSPFSQANNSLLVTSLVLTMFLPEVVCWPSFKDDEDRTIVSLGGVELIVDSNYQIEKQITKYLF